MRPTTYPIERMLQKQPIRGNSQAVEQCYLHWAMTLPWDRFLPGECSTAVLFEKDKVARALLVAGADPAQLDSNDDTPLSKAVREMENEEDDAFWEIGHWLQPLSRGVDVHRKNKQGRSVEDYLATILEDDDRPDLQPFTGLLEFTLAEDEKPVKREIRWPQ